jgi:hypothetical protein
MLLSSEGSSLGRLVCTLNAGTILWFNARVFSLLRIAGLDLLYTPEHIRMIGLLRSEIVRVKIRSPLVYRYLGTRKPIKRHQSLVIDEQTGDPEA